MRWVLMALFCLGLALCIRAWAQRARAGFGRGHTVSQDSVRLVSYRYGLIGRPDRIVKVDGFYIPEEKKPGRTVYETYKAQLGVYLLLIEEHYGIRPPYGVLVLGDGKRVTVANTEALRNQVLAIAANIRQHRQALEVTLSPPANPRHCLGCGLREHCAVRRA